MVEPQAIPELDANATRAWVLGSLHARGSAHEDLVARTRRSLRWFRELVLKAGRGVPFALVHDLGYLLLEGDAFPFRSLVELAGFPREERDARLGYENRLLNALLRDTSVRRANLAIARDPSRDDLVARAVALLLAPLLEGDALAGTPTVNPVILRELEPRGALAPAAEAARWDAVVGLPGAHLVELRAAQDRLLGRGGEGPALGAEALAEIENWSAYRRAAQRRAGARIAARAESLPSFDPRRARVAEESADQETELPDSGYYPEGGFSELATRGSLENLVPSELLYLGEHAFRGIDMFALRYLEREALFYKRDSGLLQRVRRAVHVAVRPDQGLWTKLPWHSDKLSVCLYGLFVRLAADLAQVFPRDAVRLELDLVAEGAEAVDRAEEDRELLRVLLRHEIARSAADVVVAPPSLDLRTLGERSRRVYGIAVQSGDGAPAGLPPRPPGDAPARDPRAPRLVVLKVGGAPPPSDAPRARSAHDTTPPVVFLPTQGPIDDALVVARDELVAEITETR